MEPEQKIKDLNLNLGRRQGVTNYLTHNLHTYPAKFIPKIPREIILLLTKEGEVVLDPFGGCGTTLVESKLTNRHGVAVDINPIAVLVSKAKTTKLTEKQVLGLDKFILKVSESIKRYYAGNEKLKYSIPSFDNLEHWFTREVISELAIIKANILKIKEENLSNYLKAVFSSVIVMVSNQESDTRFAAINKGHAKMKTFTLFSDKLKRMNPRIMEFSKLASDAPSDIHCADSRNLDFLKENSVDLVVTSPPYANTYDYYLYHKFRMYWLDYNVKETQLNEIGSRDKHSSKKQDIGVFENDLHLCVKEISRVLKPSKYAVIVIGDSVIRGELIKADNFMKKICQDQGLMLIRKISYPLSKASRMFNPKFTNNKKEEHIMFFKNNK